jgi:hypothetical protein
LKTLAAHVAAGGDPASAGNHGKAAVATTAAPKANPMGCWAMRDRFYMLKIASINSDSLTRKVQEKVAITLIYSQVAVSDPSEL